MDDCGPLGTHGRQDYFGRNTLIYRSDMADYNTQPPQTHYCLGWNQITICKYFIEFHLDHCDPLGTHGRQDHF